MLRQRHNDRMTSHVHLVEIWFANVSPMLGEFTDGRPTTEIRNVDYTNVSQFGGRQVRCIPIKPDRNQTTEHVGPNNGDVSNDAQALGLREFATRNGPGFDLRRKRE